MPTLYPSALVRLVVRLDEGAAESAELAAAVTAPVAPTAATQGLQATGQTRPVAVELPRPGEGLAVVVGVVPLTVSLTRGSIRDPDTCSVSIDAGYLPVDPRMVRQLACDVFLGALDPTEYGEGIETGDTSRSTVAPSAETWRFVGWADEGTWSLAAGEFRAEFRGLLSLLSDAKIHPDVLAGLDVGRRLHEVVRDLVDIGPMSRGMRVVVRGVSSAALMPDLVDVLPKSLRSRKDKVYRLPAEDAGESYWETILRLCQLVGWVASVELDAVVLQPARTLWRGVAEADVPQVDARTGIFIAPLPAFRRTVDGGQVLTARRMVFGINLEALDLTRPWGEAARRAVEVRAHVPGQRGVISARYPQDATPARVNTRGRGQATATEEVDVLTVHGISTEAQAREVARQVWHARAMRDLRGSFSTRDLASYGGSGTDADLLDLRGGETVEIRLAATAEGGSSPEYEASLGRAEMVGRLRNRNIDERTAAEWTAAFQRADLPAHFRVAAVTYDWSHEDGLTTSVEFTGYLDAKLDEGRP